MTNHDSGGWLEAVLVDAQDARWCTRPHCTTCGCLEFRRAFWSGAAHQVGVRTARLQSASHPRGLLEGFSAGEHEATVRALVAGLRQLPPEWRGTDALRTIIIDLYPPLITHGLPIDLATELSGTPAGEELARIEAHDQLVRAERARREAYESPEAVEERKRVKRADKARAHSLRQSQTRKRNAERLKLLASLARLSVVERLSRFATDPALNLDCVSPDLIPEQEGDLVDLETPTAVALIERIGRRKGKWGHLRRMVEQRLKAECESRSSEVYE